VSLDALYRPAAGEPEGALVLFHGRGANERDLLPLLAELDPERRFAGFTPRGPLTYPPGGGHWYQFRQVGYPDPETFRFGFRNAAEWLDGLDFPPERTILGGFSQGAVMGYALGLAAGRPRPAAILAFSGFVPTVPDFELDLSEPLPPIAIGHGVYDDVIPVEFGRQAHELLPHALYREYPLPHAIDPSFAQEVSTWLTSATTSSTRSS
jgi:phospholipase/carboxylesterase